MKNLGRRIGRAIGMGLVWGAAWFGAGVLVARVPGITSDLPFAYQFAPFGILSGIICAAFFGVLEGYRRLDPVSLSRVAGCGAVCGLLTAVIVATLRGEMSEVLLFGPVLALAGALCAAGSLAVVRRSTGATQADPSWGPTQA